MSHGALAQRFSDLLEIQRNVPTSWSVRQRDSLDRATAFIYRCDSLAEVRERCTTDRLDDDTESYALHRWKNFVRHDAWLDLVLTTIPASRPYEEPKHRTRDLYLPLAAGETVFDLKVTRWPSRIPLTETLLYVAEWMYVNQSQQSRHHLDNRLFVVGVNELILCDIEIARRSVLAFWEQRQTSVFQVVLQAGRPTAGVVRVSE